MRSGPVLIAGLVYFCIVEIEIGKPSPVEKSAMARLPIRRSSSSSRLGVFMITSLSQCSVLPSVAGRTIESVELRTGQIRVSFFHLGQSEVYQDFLHGAFRRFANNRLKSRGPLHDFAQAFSKGFGALRFRARLFELEKVRLAWVACQFVDGLFLGEPLACQLDHFLEHSHVVARGYFLRIVVSPSRLPNVVV